MSRSKPPSTGADKMGIGGDNIAILELISGVETRILIIDAMPDWDDHTSMHKMIWQLLLT